MLYTNPDVGWLVQTGQYLLDHGLPKADPFTWTKTSTQVIVYQWLWDLACAGLFRFGSLWFVGLACCLAVGVLIFFLLPLIWMKQGLPLYVPFAALAFVQTPNWFHARPQLCSYFLTLAAISLLERYRLSRNWKWLLALPPLMLLWANTHLLWTCGLLVMAIYAGAQWWRSKQLPTALLLAFSASALCTLATPYGVSLPAYVLTFFGGSQYGHVWEMMPSFSTLEGMLAIWCLPLAWAALIAGRKKVPLEGFALSIILTLAALFIRRFQPLAVIGMWTYLGYALTGIKLSWLAADRSYTWRAAAATAALALLVPVLSWYAKMPTLTSAWMIYTEDSLPLLMSIGKVLTADDRLFNEPTIGSWLVGIGSSSVFVDTRFDLYPKKFLDQMNDCLDGKERWQNRLSDWGITHVVVRDQTPLNQMMMYAPGWSIVLHDGRFAWWSRDTDLSYQQLKHWSLTDESLIQSQLPKWIIDSTVETRSAKYLLMARIYREHNQPALAMNAAQRGLNLLPESKALRKELVLAGSAM